MLTPEQEVALLGGGDCVLHYHAQDQQCTHDQLQQLEASENVRTMTIAGNVAYKDDIILLNSTAGAFAAYLPIARGGKRLIFTRVAGSGTITLTASSPETINGAASCAVSANYTPVRLKAIKGVGWVTI